MNKTNIDLVRVVLLLPLLANLNWISGW